MLKQISKTDKALILLEFTKYLLMHSGAGELAKLKNILWQEEKESAKGHPITKQVNNEIIKEIITEKERGDGFFIKKREKDEIIFEKNLGQEFKTRSTIPKMRRPLVLRIPEPRLPPNLQYLKPTPHNVEIDLGKLNSLVQDPVVRRIECNGPGEYVVAMVPTPRYTNTILNKEEIEEIIKAFEKKSRIPAHEGIYNVVVGKLVFSAIISDVIGSKFSINKMAYGFG
ncbi:hypothetical protein A3K62_00525 [Candidatus Pacearchaeota archaeon RBG_16_35_8]|nr:MAG: hypothetical protein A3K62_00525 [Candidatus Pacearchaeota archaeon RBG_16_35_8]